MSRVRLTYVGRRLTSKQRVAHFFQLEDGSKIGFKKMPIPALIGERISMVQVDDGKWAFSGKEGPKRLDEPRADLDEIAEWTAIDRATAQLQEERKVERKLKARKTHFDEVLEPVKAMVRATRTHSERAALINAITAELWKR